MRIFALVALALLGGCMQPCQDDLCRQARYNAGMMMLSRPAPQVPFYPMQVPQPVTTTCNTFTPGMINCVSN